MHAPDGGHVGQPAGLDGGAPDGRGGGSGQGLSLGQACGAAGDCASGFCFDGLCCDRDCSAACYTCAGEGSRGTCLPAEAETDPRDQCADQGAASCGTDGVCDGAGACRKYQAGTICAQPSCTGSTLTQASRCDGAGACVPSATQPCDPYVCGAGGACLTTCTGDRDCKAPGACNSGSCGKRPLGQPCATPDDCNSG